MGEERIPPEEIKRITREKRQRRLGAIKRRLRSVIKGRGR
jgi:hypothetical protein